MQNSFFQAICRIGIFMICVRAIIHFRPNESYEKYLRLLAGILIMIQLFLPVGRLILGKGGQEAAQVLQEFRQELERGMEEAAESAAAADALLEQMTLEEIQRRLEEQAFREEAGDVEADPERWEATPGDVETDPERREAPTADVEADPERREAPQGDVETGQERREALPADREANTKNREEKPADWEEKTDGAGNGITVRVEEIKPVSIGSLPSEAE